MSRLRRWTDRSIGAFLMLLHPFARVLRVHEEDFFLGRSGRVIKLFRSSSPLGTLVLNAPSLWRGEVNLVGVSLRKAGSEPVNCGKVLLLEPPGLLSLYELRNRIGGYEEQQTEIDLEYLRERSLKKDLAILVRSFLAHLLEGGALVPDVPLLGIRIDNLSNAEALEKIMSFTAARTSRQVSFVNAHCANVAQEHEPYKRVLCESDLCLPDGIGVKIGAALSGYQILENVNGTDLLPRILYELQKTSGKISLLGARPGIAERVADYISQTYPEIRLGVVQHGYFQASEEPAIIQSLADSDSDVLLVAMGVPGQDLWLADNLAKLKVGVGLGVGGLFDFYSNTIPRAPSWVRAIGMEWAFRLYQEPKRLWRRYLIGNFVFVYRVLLSRKGKSK